MKRFALIGLLFMLASQILASQCAQGGQACVAYRLKAPIVGTRAGRPCLPDPFSQTFTVYHCEAVPPVGVSACATASVDTP